ncbi:MAG TPA: hypothetical protein VM694_35995, partial [Polyangium sp.]|nr:hypothetical protein [Polyangium sp.]
WSALDPQAGALEEQDSLRASRVDGQGMLLDNPPLQLGAYRVVAATAVAGDTLLVLQYAGGYLYSARIPFRLDAQGNVTELSELPHGFSGALASDGTNALYVWGADPNGSGSGNPTILRAARLDTNATMLDPSGLTVANQNELLCGFNVAYGAGVYLIAWRAFDLGTKVTRERAARVTPDGVVLDPQGLWLDEHPDPNGYNGCRFSRWDQRPAVAFDGSLFVVARYAPGASPRHDILRGVTVAPDGTVSTAFDISTEPGILEPVELASRGDGETMAAFSRFVEGAPYESVRVRLSRITSMDPVEPLDAGTDGGEVMDAGMDAGEPLDAGTDAGEPLDAGMDASEPLDAGTDASEPLDAGVGGGEPFDAGTGFDAGPGGGPIPGGGGCSYSVEDAERAPSLLFLSALGVLLSVKRRAGGARRSHPRA